MWAGTIVDMKELGVWEPYEVKAQTIKTAIESATLLLRIDDIVSGLAKRDKLAPGQSSAPQKDDPDQVGQQSLGSLTEAVQDRSYMLELLSADVALHRRIRMTADASLRQAVNRGT